MQFCELSGLLNNAINVALSAVGSSCVPVLWVGGLLLGLFFIPSSRRVSYFMASGTHSVGEYHLDCVVYVLFCCLLEASAFLHLYWILGV